jgi:hypothetical protein
MRLWGNFHAYSSWTEKMKDKKVLNLFCSLKRSPYLRGDERERANERMSRSKVNSILRWNLKINFHLASPLLISQLWRYEYYSQSERKEAKNQQNWQFKRIVKKEMSRDQTRTGRITAIFRHAEALVNAASWIRIGLSVAVLVPN